MRNHCVGLLVLVTALFATFSAQARELDLRAWVHDPIITSVSVSPDGKMLAALTQPPGEPFGAPQVTTWRLDAMNEPPKRVAPADTRALGVSWLNDEHLFVVGRRVIDYTGTYILDSRPVRNGRWFRNKWYVVNVNSGKFTAPRLQESPPEGEEIFQPELFNSLPLQSDYMLLNDGRRIARVSISNLTTENAFRIADDTSGLIGDALGNVRVRQEGEGDDTDARNVTYARSVGGAWKRVAEFRADTRRGRSVVGISSEDPNILYMSDNVEGNLSVIREYNLETDELSAPIFSHPKWEVFDVVQSTRPDRLGELIGYVLSDEVGTVIYTDPDYKALQERINAALPAGRRNSIVDHSNDFSTVVINSSSATVPPEWYLLVDGSQLILLGKEYPLISESDLGEVQWVTYKARDGLEIPAILATPSHGEPPYPTIINPHGGPWARDFITWGPIRSVLVASGYAVLQPQYRGSTELGWDLWRAGDEEWGQKMQDDKDDGAAWMVEQGLADPNRIAMWGYSYGGYAAMAAVVRPNTPYQCAIAGAGLSELRSFRKYVGRSEFGEGFQQWTIKGLEPIREVEKASIPIYIFHGDRDQRVPINQGEKYYRALKRAGKDVKWLSIPDLWHSRPWLPQHKLAIYESSLDYLKNECGPGGL